MLGAFETWPFIEDGFDWRVEFWPINVFYSVAEDVEEGNDERQRTGYENIC